MIKPDLMPAPAELDWSPGRLAVETGLTFNVGSAESDPRVPRAIERLLRTWSQRTGITFAASRPSASPTDKPATTVSVTWVRSSPAVPRVDEDESYSLKVTAHGAELSAETSVGALRAIATLQQLLADDDQGWYLPWVAIRDRPRFPWRGLLIDVARHWQPMGVIKRNLDGMALVKLNVLHLHLTDDQGFRVESKAYPELQAKASDGNYFTQEEVREIVAYAADRGIRVVPEFDVPGHATSWVVALPELASAPGPYSVERHWGVFNPVLDPTSEETYTVLDRFLGEMAGLFPDPYIHIGGDENNGVQWNANTRIQEFIRDHGLKDDAGLHAYFNHRLRDILARHAKKMIGWDEILNGDLPKDAVIQSWRGPTGLAAAARAGYATILSNGYYIDLCYSAAEHYRNDPLPAGTPLTPLEQGRVLGGEATMWSEWVTPETIDSRIWPRTAAIAERLWSPRNVSDVSDMYRRLSVVSRRLEEIGLNHERNRPAMVRRLVGDAAGFELVDKVTTLVALVEPVKHYERAEQQPGSTSFSPLTGLVDCARPESNSARRFNDAAARFASNRSDESASRQLQAQLRQWRDAAGYVRTHVDELAPAARLELGPVAEQVAALCRIAAEALQSIDRAEPKSGLWFTGALSGIDAAARPHAAVQIPIAGSVRMLVEAVPHVPLPPPPASAKAGP